MTRDLTRFPRRTLLRRSAAVVAGATLPAWFVRECAAADPSPAPPVDKPRVALIGCGGMGRGDAKNASRFGQIVALCDVDAARIAEARQDWPEAKTYSDFRAVVESPDIDVVICATVDHWHALVSIAAMRAGKNVYCEKPLTLTIGEGPHVIRTAEETRRILQTGSQQRSDEKFRLACELVRNGRVGKVQHVDVFLPTGQREGPFNASTPPADFNWEMWQGPTPRVDYVKERTHVTFRYWWDYSGGTMTDWGAHHNDIVLWGLGKERTGPVAVRGESLVNMIPGGFTAASEYAIQYTYADGVTHHCRSTSANNWFGGVVDPEGQQHGVKFIGSDGWIFVSRGIIQASSPELLTDPLPPGAERLYVSNDHMRNFFECVQSRKPTICEPAIGHRSASVCHLGVIALRLGRELRWNPDTERFVDDAEADNWISRPMTRPWTFDAV